jgi:hypothetical protein
LENNRTPTGEEGGTSQCHLEKYEMGKRKKVKMSEKMEERGEKEKGQKIKWEVKKRAKRNAK